MIKLLQLKDFRNFTSKSLEFSSKVTAIVGPNASGKTNVLESIQLLSTGKSFKARLEEEMINYEAELSRVKGVLESEVSLEALVTRGFISRGALSEKTAKKRLLVNNTPRRLVDFADNLKTVLFRPADMDLVTQTPSLRRKFMDNVLSQADREYRRSILTYEKGLRRRNRILLRIREEGIARSHLYFWDNLLVKNGEYITAARAEFIDFVNKTDYLGGERYALEYDKSIISPARLEQYARQEVSAGTTLVGPHRDDFIFEIKEDEEKLATRDLARFGSRGEQRMGVLWLKMAELSFVEEKTKIKPTLLLDDIFSELDHEHRDIVFAITNNQQTILTTADKHFLPGKKLHNFEIFSL